MMTKTIKQIQRGDVVTRVPYPERTDRLPLTVEWVHQARQKGSMILEGVNADGRRIQIPVGHFTNTVEVA
jgi:hypothetical protein